MVQRSDRLSLIARLLRDDAGQDLVEYAILTGLIAVGTVLVILPIAGLMNTAYAGNGGWNQASQGLWEPCAPNLGTCP